MYTKLTTADKGALEKLKSEQWVKNMRAELVKEETDEG